MTFSQRPGFLRGWHYTQLNDMARALRSDDATDAAELLLWGIVLATEAEAATEAHGRPASWAYEQLAIMARKAKAYPAEVAIIERYLARTRVPHEKMEERHPKARALYDRHTPAAPLPMLPRGDVTEALEAFAAGEPGTGPFAAAVTRLLELVPLLAPPDPVVAPMPVTSNTIPLAAPPQAAPFRVPPPPVSTPVRAAPVFRPAPPPPEAQPSMFIRMVNQIVRGLGSLWSWWIADIRKRRGAGRWASLGIGLFAICCACSIPVGMVRGPQQRQSVGNVDGVVPISEARGQAARIGGAAPAASEAPAAPVVREAAATPRPRNTPRPTAVPAATPAPPLGQAQTTANLRRRPLVRDDNVIARLCPGDQLDYLSVQLVGGERWYEVRVQQQGADCGARRAAVGNIGWAAASVVSEPSYAVEQYADQIGRRLPTAMALPPTAVPTRAPVPAQQTARCDPSYPDVCIPPGPDLNCGDVPYRRFRVIGADPHGFDRDRDGVGCES